MPELPEVEVASRQLRRWLEGKRIVSARAYETRVIRGQGRARFAELTGHVLAGIDRVGKWMVLKFDGGEALVAHLGMTGKWIRRKLADPEAPHTRALFELDDGHAVDYRDPRLFGRLVRGKSEKMYKLPALSQLGPDPLGGIDLDRLEQVLKRTKRSLKEALMDQRTLAGLGNIYVSESLWRAKLDPRRPGTSVTGEEVARLAKAIGQSLQAALDAEDGPEPITYVEEGGENRFFVYDRAGQPCARCKTALRRIVQGGRSTFYCPSCQVAARKRPPARKAAKKEAASSRR